MYQLSVTVIETLGCYICTAAISSRDQFGRVTQVASSAPTYLETDPAFLEDDLLQILRAAERFVRLRIDPPASR